MLNISGFYDAAWFRIRGIGEKYFGLHNQKAALGLISTSAEKSQEESYEGSTISGNTAGWQTRSIERMAEGQEIILHGCPLEVIAALCFEHHYCWSLHHDSVSRGRVSFLLMPSLSPVAEKVHPPKSES
jgi:hypothetical protein